MLKIIRQEFISKPFLQNSFFKRKKVCKPTCPVLLILLSEWVLNKRHWPPTVHEDTVVCVCVRVCDWLVCRTMLALFLPHAAMSENLSGDFAMANLITDEDDSVQSAGMGSGSCCQQKHLLINAGKTEELVVQTHQTGTSCTFRTWTMTYFYKYKTVLDQQNQNSKWVGVDSIW